MGQAIETLARFVAETPWNAIPTMVRQHAKLVLLDTLGVIVAGSVQPEVAGARARLTATGGHGATIYAAGAPTADPRTAAVPVIALTADAKPDDRARGLAAGFNGYVTKPLMFDELAALLDALAASKRR